MKVNRRLLGRRIAVRSYTAADLEFCTGMWFDPENGWYLSDPDREHVDEVFLEALEGMEDSTDGYYFIVELRHSGERIGTCCVFPDRGVYDIGYCIHKSRWRQGYGRELVELIIEWIRAKGGTAVTAEAAKENRASRALLEGCGFTAVRETSYQKYNMDVRFSGLIYQKSLPSG